MAETEESDWSFFVKNGDEYISDEYRATTFRNDIYGKCLYASCSNRVALELQQANQLLDTPIALEPGEEISADQSD